MSEPAPLPGALLAQQLIAAVKGGWVDQVRSLLEQGADANAADEQGIRALYFACAGDHPQLATLLFKPLELDLIGFLRRLPGASAYAEIARLLLGHGGHPNERFVASGITPLMVAKCFRCDEVIAVLLELGARGQIRDAAGRSADRFTLFGTMARLIEFCARAPNVKAAYLAELHAPKTEEYSSPLVGLELDGPLPADAFAGWPTDEPIVAMGISDDAVSRLLKLTPPVYDRTALASGLAVAASLAKLLGGQVHFLATNHESTPVGVSLPSGQTPILVRDYGYTLRISVQDAGTFSPCRGAEAAAVLPQVVAMAQAWGEEQPTRVAIVDAAVELLRVLSQELGEGWFVSIPGTHDPTEMWLRGQGEVGLFAGRAVVWVGGESRSASTGSRAALEGARASIVLSVKAQQAQYALNREAAERVRVSAQELLRELEQRVPAPDGGAWECRSYGSTGHSQVAWASLGYRRDGSYRESATVKSEAGVISAHAGLFGGLGWEGSIEPLAPAIDGIVLAIQKSFLSLTVDQLALGRRYEVVKSIQELVQGDVVEYLGLNDIDNHYGEYNFKNQDGKTVVVGGDCSSIEGNPLREVHLHLKVQVATQDDWQDPR